MADLDLIAEITGPCPCCTGRPHEPGDGDLCFRCDRLCTWDAGCCHQGGEQA